MTETLDAKLARITARVHERASTGRERLARHPDLLEFCELSRAKFGAKLTWLEDDLGELGRRPDDELLAFERPA